MPVSKDALKKRACEAIDRNKEKICHIGDTIFNAPELGFKEFKTAELVKNTLDSLGIGYISGVALTGVVASLKGRQSIARVAIMGELDALIAPKHSCADPLTGAAHSCGHNCMIAALMGVGYALSGTGIMEELDGDIALMAVPAEEYIELEYRSRLKEEGKIIFLSGKQEFIRLGVMDDVDIMIMQHSSIIGSDGKVCASNYSNNGFTAKLVRYIGKASHAGMAPHLGVNALNAATLGLQAIAMQRETYRDEDSIRVHPIITKGGDAVNIVPSDVRIETFIRGNNIDAILDASAKVDRAFKAGGYAIGAETVITDLPGFMPMCMCYPLMDVVYDNMKTILGEEYVSYEDPQSGGSTDAGDISNIIPATHSRFKCARGVPHGSDYEIADKEAAYITPAKVLICTAIDLLYGDAKKAMDIKREFKPPMTKEEYLRIWGKMEI